MSKGMIFFIGCIFGIVVNELYHRYSPEETKEKETSESETKKDETENENNERKSYKDTVRNLHYSSEPTVPLNDILTNKKGEPIDRDGNHIEIEKTTISKNGIETEVEVRKFMRNENGDVIKEDDGMTPLEREIEYSEKINAMLAARPKFELIDENTAQEDMNIYGYDRFICTYYAGNNVLFNDDDNCLLLMDFVGGDPSVILANAGNEDFGYEANEVMIRNTPRKDIYDIFISDEDYEGSWDTMADYIV